VAPSALQPLWHDEKFPGCQKIFIDFLRNYVHTLAAFVFPFSATNFFNTMDRPQSQKFHSKKAFP